MRPIALVIVALMIYASCAYLRRRRRATPGQEAEALREADERLREIERES